MRKAVIYVFSGTGNTRYAADKIAEALTAYDVNTTVWETRAPFDDIPDPNDYDIVGFGYPVHAFNAPKFFLKFVKSLPKVNNKQAFIFKTSGEPFRINGASSLTLTYILKRKGFKPMLDRHLLMPYNIMFRYDDALAKQMYLHTAQISAPIAYKIAQNQKENMRYNIFAAAVMYVFRVQWFGAWLNGPLIHADKNICTGCGLCEQMCPTQNIKITDGVPVFGSKCSMCMSCVFRCPVDAIRPGFLNHWRVNGVYKYDKIVTDPLVPDKYIDENTTGYFKLFREYYKKTNKEISEFNSEQKEKI